MDLKALKSIRAKALSTMIVNKLSTDCDSLEEFKSLAKVAMEIIKVDGAGNRSLANVRISEMPDVVSAVESAIKAYDDVLKYIQGADYNKHSVLGRYDQAMGDVFRLLRKARDIKICRVCGTSCDFYVDDGWTCPVCVRRGYRR
jgi:rubrerythrin